VLRSNALSTGQNAMRGLLGTTAGFLVGCDRRADRTNTTVLWVLLPIAVLFGGLARPRSPSPPARPLSPSRC